MDYRVNIVFPDFREIEERDEGASLQQIIIQSKRSKISELSSLPSAQADRLWRHLRDEVPRDLLEVVYLKLWGVLSLEETIKIVGGNLSKWRYSLRRFLEQLNNKIEDKEGRA